MDSNDTRFLLLADADDFACTQRDLAWDARTASLGLVQRQPLRLSRPVPAAAMIAWRGAQPLVRDDFGQLGRLSNDGAQFQMSTTWPSNHWPVVRAEAEDGAAAGFGELVLAPVEAPDGTRFTDLALGGELAALPYSDDADTHGLVLVHLRLRWRASCALPERPVRAWVEPIEAQDAGQRSGVDAQDRQARVWLLGNGRLMLVAREAADGALSQSLLTLARADVHRAGAIRLVALDPELPFATDLAALGGGRLALLAPRAPADTAFRNRDCALAVLGAAARAGAQSGADDRDPRAELVRERWPMHSLQSVRFVGAADGRVRYLADNGPRELVPLPQARFPHRAEGTLRRRLDSGQPDCLWHRLLFEGCIPPGCGIAIQARVSDEARGLTSAPWQLQRPPAWRALASELPWDSGRLTPIPGRQGLFEVLLQRPNGRVRELRGRYLQLRLTLTGDGRQTPRIKLLRAWFPRHSWQQAFLPQHFHQQERPAVLTLAEARNEPPTPANGADARERLLAAFEGMLTPLEDQIATAEVLVDPLATPAARLAPLAELLAAAPPAAWPEARRRRWISQVGTIQRLRGTLRGLALALDIATDGLVARGQVIPVENYRLRRTLATILGIEFSDDDHPLTLGTGQSGNSIVGPSLILTDEDASEFLALFAPELAQTEAERETVDAFFDRYARRLTLVLHGEARALRRTCEQVLERETPAAITWVIRETEHPFALGLSPLLGIDSFLEPRPPFGRVTVGATRLDRGDLVRGFAALDPTLVSAARPATGPTSPP